MRRWGDGDRFLDRIAAIRAAEPGAAFRSNFIVGYPGETEADHDALLDFVDEAQVDWCGFFAYSREDGTYAADLDGAVPDALVAERLAELRELQDGITAARRDRLVGTTVDVLVDEPGPGPQPPGGARDRRRRARARVARGRPTSTPSRSSHALGPDLVAEVADAERITGGAGSAWAGTGDMSDATVVRALGPGHAGQRRHRHPAARRPAVLLLIVDDGAVVAPSSACGCCSPGTDGVDGWIARRHGTTRSGAFLDPLADKVLVLGAHVRARLHRTASGGSRSRCWPCARWSITLYRSQWGRRGVAVPARPRPRSRPPCSPSPWAWPCCPLAGRLVVPGRRRAVGLGRDGRRERGAVRRSTAARPSRRSGRTHH